MMRAWTSVAGALVFCLTALAQTTTDLGDKLVHLVRTPPPSAVAVIRVMNRGTPIEQDSPFKAGEDWLKDISITIKNTSPRKIVFVSVDAQLPDTGLGTPENPRVAAGNSVGRKPEHAMYSAMTGKLQHDAQGNPIDLEPGADLVVPIVSEKDYGDIKSLIEEKQNLSSVSRCEIWVTTVYFADGTKWSPGHYWQPDMSRPGRYTPLSARGWMQEEQPH
jgi:hypothetical protein